MAYVKMQQAAILAIFLSGRLLHADSPDAAPLPLPGHDLKLDETVKHCQGALVATLEKVNDVLDPGPTPTMNYETLWKVKEILRGEYASEATLVIRVRDLPKEETETLPTVNKTYLLIGYGPVMNPDEIAIVLDDTNENRDKIKTLLQK